MTDDELMHAISLQDREAFTALVQRHLDQLYGYAYRLTRSQATAEDLVQDMWLRVWENAASYKPGKVRLITWLYRVLHNRFVDLERKKSPEIDTPRVEQEVSGLQHDQELELERHHARMHAALYKLPSQQRAALLLSQAQGFSNGEVARIMGISVRAVESQQARGRRTLRKLLANSVQPSTPST